MILSELMERLETMFPNAKLESWKPEYKHVLGNIPGQALQDAFDRTMTGWVKASPPKPAEIKANLALGKTGKMPTRYRLAATEEEAEAWRSTHSYLNNVTDWRNILVREDFGRG